METRKIGSLTVPVIGLGCNNFGGRLDADQTAQVVHAAIDAGITFFDTADVYGQSKSEEFIGQALGARRKDVILATKFGSPLEGFGKGASAEYIQRAVEGSLRRLQTDYIDLYQLHRPDPEVPIAETLGALNDLVKAGKVREIGCSNFSVAQIKEAEAATPAGAARFISVQNNYSLMEREPEQGVLAECERLGLAFLPFFPLASGLLTGKYRRGQSAPQGTRLASREGALTDERLAVVEQLIEYAETRGHTILELAVSWLLARPVVASVIAGATRPEQITANAAAGNWKMTAEDLAAIDTIMA